MNSYSLSYFKYKKSQKYNYYFYNCRLKHLKNAVKFAQMLFFMDGLRVDGIELGKYTVRVQ